MIVFGLSRSLPLSIAALVLSGVGDMLSVNIRGILVPLNTPDALRGRVSAVNWMFIGASNELGRVRIRPDRELVRYRAARWSWVGC